ncbi:hypothetical protein PORY_000264 [Pneumocystis oryctolagi]|uniref:Uncharacterized protein n=1 Tax=Pneumocystis oryctolagi TaxID=42067 RepID=A0ACB7CF23_9ASCO|nr:hypothetical protein PORY_000264 [Pneumocystis oryctolagi]
MNEKSILKSIPSFEEETNKFVCVFPEKNEIHLYTVDNNQDTLYSLISKKSKIPFIKCICCSPSHKNTIAIGETTGDALILNLDNEFPPIRFSIKQQRSCNAIALNTLGDLLAVGLEKMKNEPCLMIWDIRQGMELDKKISPLQQLVLSEPVFSLSYFPDSPKQLISGINLRWIKIFDLREKPSISTATLSTRFIYNIAVDPKNPNYFASTSDEGLVSIWDRRKYSNSEHCLLLNRGANQFSRIIDLKFIGTRPGQLSGLSKEGIIKLWDINYNHDTPNHLITSFHDNKRLSEVSEPSVSIKNDLPHLMHLREASINSDEKIISFDYISYESYKNYQFYYLRSDDKIGKIKIRSFYDSVSINSLNEMIISEKTNLLCLSEKNKNTILTKNKIINDDNGSQASESLTLNIDENLSNNHIGESEIFYSFQNSKIDQEYDIEYKFNIKDTLKNDISYLMYKRAKEGYGMDTAKNKKILENTHLFDLWAWINNAENLASENRMTSGDFDLSYQGVYNIWYGVPSSKLTKKCDENNKNIFFENSYTIAVKEINNKFKNNAFTSVISRVEIRKLALISCGWNISCENLDDKIKQLEEEGLYSKAASRALFHGNFNRAVQALSKGIEKHRLMSTAIAGFTSTKNNINNTMWKEMCRKMSTELDDPYLRAIFAYVSNGDWRDVLDEQGLSLKERIGVGLRFLSDEDFSFYLNDIVKNVINTGDLEGIILTGISTNTIDLLETYLNRTSDIQTAALVSSLCLPKFFDQRILIWISDYRQLLNRYSLFYTRAKFDVSRKKYSRNSNDLLSLKETQKIYIRCNFCNKSITHKSITSKKNTNIRSSNTSAAGTIQKVRKSNTLCPTCSKPLPRCSICLFSLGTSNNSEKEDVKSQEDFEKLFEKWFNFCLSCHHVSHHEHARECYKNKSKNPTNTMYENHKTDNECFNLNDNNISIQKTNTSKFKKHVRCIIFYVKHTWEIFTIGQILSLMITASSVFTTKLSDYHINIPTFQTFPNYAFLALIYTCFSIHSFGFKKYAKIVLKNGWKYFILAFLDVEANFLVVKAYTYTNILSCMLLDSFSIITAFILSFFFLKVKYNIPQILGILICFGGTITLAISDFKTKKSYTAKNPIKGDIFMIIGSSLYGLSNILEEIFVSEQPIYEVIGQLGIFGTFINIIQAYIFERKYIRNIQWSFQTIWFIFAYNISLFIFYSLTPILFRMSSAVFYNMSLLTSDFWGFIVGIYLFHYHIYWLYPLSFVLIILGLSTYHLFFKDESKKPWINYDYQKETNNIKTYKISTDSQTSSIHKNLKNVYSNNNKSKISTYSISMN